MMSMLGSGFQRLESTLVARERMQGALSSNIANAETPNYQADQRTFADFLAEQKNTGQSDKAVTTNRMHFADTDTRQNLTMGLFHQQHAHKMDGNTVDIQKEMARMSENQLMYQLSLRLIKGKLNGLKNAIKEGR